MGSVLCLLAWLRSGMIFGCVLQCVALRCSVLQCVAVRCSVGGDDYEWAPSCAAWHGCAHV